MSDLWAIRKQGVVALGLLLLLIANHTAPAVAQLATRCGAGLALCPLGRWGLGGCFNIGDAQCTNGLICPKGSEACPPGSDGPGGCVIQGRRTCQNGLVCDVNQTACPPGTEGTGGCYQPDNAACQAGRICQKGEKNCSPTTPGVVAVPPPAADNACRTPAGDERRAVLDTVRAAVAKDLGPPIGLVVRKIRICGEWAFVIAEPNRAGGGTMVWRGTVCDGDTSHLVGALARRAAAAGWTLKDYALCPGDVAWAEWPETHGAPEQLFAD